MPAPGTFHDARVRDEVFRAARICAPCFDHLGELTFSGKAAAVATWKTAVFEKHLLPAACKAFEVARSGGARELAAIDQLLDESLAAPLAGRSRDGGRMLTLEFKAPVGERTLERYSRAVAEGGASGHFVTIFAARACAFHIPPTTALAAMLLLEFRQLPLADVWEAVSASMDNLPVFPNLLRAA